MSHEPEVGPVEPLQDCLQRAEYVIGPLYCRPIMLSAGQKIEAHRHDTPHVTFVLRGSVRVHAWCDDGCDREEVFTAGMKCLIPAQWDHEMEALEDDTKVECIFSHFDPAGRAVQEYDGWNTSGAEDMEGAARRAEAIRRVREDEEAQRAR